MKFLSEKRDEIKKMMPTAKVHEVAKKRIFIQKKFPL